MNNVELTEFQLTALSKFNGVRALTETGLARTLKCEKVVARHAVTTLKNAGLIKSLGAYEFMLTAEGQLRLGGKAEPDKKAKREADKIPASGATTFKVIEDKPPAIAAEAVHNVPAAEQPLDEVVLADLKHQEHLAFDAAFAKPSEPDHQPQQAEDWVPEPAQPSFDELVRRGLERLNQQLGLKPVQIDDIDLKIEALTKLACTTEPFAPELADLVKATAKDLHRIRWNYTGEDARSS